MNTRLIYLFCIIFCFLGVFLFSDTFFLMSIEDEALKSEIIYEQKRLEIYHPKNISEITIHKEVESFKDLKKLKNLKVLTVNHTNNQNLKEINDNLHNNRLDEVTIAFGQFDIDNSLTTLLNSDKVKIHFAKTTDLSAFRENPPKTVNINCDYIVNKLIVDELENQTEFFIN